MCSGPAWKREIVPDHKVGRSVAPLDCQWLTLLQFDFIDAREFTDNGFFMRLK